VVSLVTDASLAKPVGSQWEDNQFIKNAMLKSDVLDLNGVNNAALKLCELAARYPSLCPFQGGRSELTCHLTTNAEKEEDSSADKLTTDYDPEGYQDMFISNAAVCQLQM
jgi:hypothetical protein